MVTKKPVSEEKNIVEELKKEILSKESKREYYSLKFQKIENQVKDSLKLQKTDETLRDITI
ncbi:hypothetical protein GW891_03685 [bacterium]|nr:hypothetical protein [bacterium]